jgi:hypothetical protein
MPVAVRYQVERQPMAMEGSGGMLRLRMPLRFRVELGVPALLGGWRTIARCNPETGAVLRLETRIEVSESWRVTPHTQGAIETLAPCRLSALKQRIQLDVSPEVRRAFDTALRGAAADLDQQIAKRAPLADWGRQLWRILREQRPVAGLAVERIGLSPLRFEGGALACGLRIQAGTNEPGEDPVLERVEDPASGGFALTLDLRMQAANVSALLEQALRGRVIEGRGRKVCVESARLTSRPGKVLIEALVSGPFRGEIGFEGIPRVKGTTLELDQLEYTIDTGNWLVRVASWFRHESYRRDFAKLARIDLGEWFQGQRVELTRGLKGLVPAALELRGGLTGIDAAEIRAGEGELEITARLRGDIELVALLGAGAGGGGIAQDLNGGGARDRLFLGD